MEREREVGSERWGDKRIGRILEGERLRDIGWREVVR